MFVTCICVGRYNKSTAKKAYHFAIQSNVICGEDGILRFAFVPKNIATGGNFGLTNLVLVIWGLPFLGKISNEISALGSSTGATVPHMRHSQERSPVPNHDGGGRHNAIQMRQNRPRVSKIRPEKSWDECRDRHVWCAIW